MLLTEARVEVSPLYFNTSNGRTKYLRKNFLNLPFSFIFIIDQNRYKWTETKPTRIFRPSLRVNFSEHCFWAVRWVFFPPCLFDFYCVFFKFMFPLHIPLMLGLGGESTNNSARWLIAVFGWSGCGSNKTSKHVGHLSSSNLQILWSAPHQENNRP